MLKAGIDPRNPADAFKAAKFSMDVMKNEGLGQWYGWKGDPWAAHGGKATGANVAVPVGPAGAAIATSDGTAGGIPFSTSSDLGDPLIPGRSADPYSQLANDLSQSVVARRKTSGGSRDLSAPLAAPGGGQPAPEFAKATPEVSAPPAVSDAVSPPADVSPLAELFRLPEIGMAAALNPKTGMPVVSRQRRMAG
jgi:hypothetical protein